MSYSVDVSGNRFRDTDYLSPEDATHSFKDIRSLGLNDTLLSWDEVGIPASDCHFDAHIHISR